MDVKGETEIDRTSSALQNQRQNETIPTPPPAQRERRENRNYGTQK